MTRRINDGVILDNTVYIKDERKAGFPIVGRVFQYLAITIGCWSIISLLREGFMIPANPMYINIAILITAVVTFALCLYPSLDGVKLFFGGAFFGLFLWSRLPALKNGFYIIENLVIHQLSQYYGFKSFEYKANYSTAGEDTTLLAIMFLIPIVALLTVAIVRSRYVNICSLILFLPVSLSFIAGILPAERYLVAYILSMLYLTKAGYSQYSRDWQQKNLMHRINSHAAIWLILFCSVLFLLMKLFIPQEKYEGISELPNMKKEIQSGLFDFSLEDVWRGFQDVKLPRLDKASGGLNGGELGATGKVEFTNSEQLRLEAPLQAVYEGIYLKGYVGSVYTGSEWKEHGKATEKSYNKLLKQFTLEEFNPVNQISMLLESQKPGELVPEPEHSADALFGFANGTMSLEYEEANRKYMYAPYFTDYNGLKGITYRGDLYPAPKSQRDSYEFNFNFNLKQGGKDQHASTYLQNQKKAGSDYFDRYLNDEKLYRSFVYQTYTKLPEQGLERLRKEFSPTSEAALGGIDAKIDYVRKYLHNNTQYSLEPGKLPKDKDFVEYFLYENKQGYCAHYASAAVLMLRSLGVPARYAEGYAIGAMDINQNDYNKRQLVTYYSEGVSEEVTLPVVQVSVRDYNAHAWVEVYFDYCGWIPVEFTPGSVIDYNSTGVDELASIGDNLAAEEERSTQPIPTLTPGAASPTPTDPTMTTTPEETTKEAVSSGANNEKVKEHNDQVFLLILGIVFAAVLLGFLIIRRYQSKREENKEHNKRALLLFRNSEKLLRLWGVLPKGCCLEDHHEDVQQYLSETEGKDFSYFIDTARRARYGRGSITTKDLEVAELFHQRLYDKIYENLPPKKKLYLKLSQLI